MPVDARDGVHGGGLLERDLELGAVRALLDRVLGGRGGRLLIEGPAGIGKSALLEASCALASEAGMQCLRAETSEVARQFAFGVVGDLLGSIEVDPAAPAEAVRAVLDRAEKEPLLIAVDDVQWADPASVRWLSLLGERIAGSRILLALSLRTGEDDARDPALRDLLDDRQTTVVRPAPLSKAAAGALVGSRIGEELDDELADACHSETAGNPYVLRTLADALRQAGVPRGGDRRARLREIGSRALTRGVARRLAALDEESRSFVEACAVAGGVGGPSGSGGPGVLAAMLGIDPARAADVAQHLAEIDLLRSADSTELSHPLVGAAIRAQLGAARREQLIRQAADSLLAAGRIEEGAARLADLPPRGDRVVAERLIEAAERATARGAPDVAAALLSRALAEPPPAQRVPGVSGALGRALLSFGDLRAIDAFERALAGTAPGPEAAALAAALAQTLNYARRTDEAVAVLDAARASLGPEHAALDEELEAMTCHYSSFDPALRRDRLARLRRHGDRRGASELAYRMRLAELASESLITCQPATETTKLAERALAGGTLLSGDSSAHAKALLALAYAGRPGAARAHLQDAIAHARTSGDTVMLAFAIALRGEARRLEGDVVAVETDTRTGLELLPPGEVGPRFMLRGLVESLVEQDEVVAAEHELREAGLTGELPELMPTPGLLLARGRARIAAGSVQLGLEDLLRAGEIAERLELRDPVSVPWRLAVAETLVDLDDGGRAAELAEEHLELARRMGAPEAVGAALRVRGRLAGGREAVSALREAVALLDGGFAKLELARALVDFGVATRRSSARGGAREALERGAVLAEQLGASTVAARANAELVEAGGRPRRGMRRGARALTQAERRVARLAAEGMTNREVAETLVVTEKTIESHLASAFRKLGIRSRADLERALAHAEPVSAGEAGRQPVAGTDHRADPHPIG